MKRLISIAVLFIFCKSAFADENQLQTDLSMPAQAQLSSVSNQVAQPYNNQIMQQNNQQNSRNNYGSIQNHGATPNYQTPTSSPVGNQQLLDGLQRMNANQRAALSNHPTIQKQTNTQYVNQSLQKNDSLQKVINNLSDQDRKIVLGIQREISTWPQNLIAELSLYRDFILTVRKEAESRYQKLSPQAKRALMIEQDMKKKLSKEALIALENAKVETNEYNFGNQ